MFNSNEKHHWQNGDEARLNSFQCIPSVSILNGRYRSMLCVLSILHTCSFYIWDHYIFFVGLSPSDKVSIKYFNAYPLSPMSSFLIMTGVVLLSRSRPGATPMSLNWIKFWSYLVRNGIVGLPRTILRCHRCLCDDRAGSSFAGWLLDVPPRAVLRAFGMVSYVAMVCRIFSH